MTSRMIDVGGLGLMVSDHGDGDPVLVLHGFTGSGRSMAPLVNRLDRYRCISPDLVGHGASDSPESVVPYRIAAVIDQLVALLDRLELGTAHVIGYSMGGRIALSMACAIPERVRRLCLIGASAGIGSADERTKRKAADDALADEIEHRGVEAFVDQWEAAPLFETQRSLPAEAWEAQRRTRLAQHAVGLANSLRGSGTGVMEPLHAELGTLVPPTLVVVGELDGKFREIGHDLVRDAPKAALAVIPGAGHATHLEAPDATAEAILGFLDVG